MVISQIAGLATAFGTGELSGAGFGPNYTILMKLGYEFFAPRILEEMEKNPNVFFQDTLWFQKFQKQIKLYSDKVMEQTLDTLLHIPQETLNAIQNKFEGEGIVNVPNIPISASPAFNRANTIAQVAQGINFQPMIDSMSNFFNQLASVFPNVPQAFGSDTPTISTTSGGTSQRQLISINLSTLRTTWRFEDLNNAMSAITKGNSPYDTTTQSHIRTLWNQARRKIDTTRTTQRQQQITTFNKVVIAPDRTPPRTTKRPAGQSVKLERNRLIKAIAFSAKRLTIAQNPKAGFTFRPGVTIETLIRDLKKLQQKLIFLLNNYIF